MNDLDILNQPYTAPTFEIWGQAFFSTRKVALVKGKGKVNFDPKIHKNMVWGIDLTIIPIEEQNARLVERSLTINEKEWGMIQASILALGIQPSDVDQKFVHIKFEQTGETYTNAAGELKNKTYIKFEQVFSTEEDCKENYITERGNQTEPSDDDGEEGSSASEQKDLPAARILLANLIRTAAKGKTTLAEVQEAAEPRMKAAPVISKYFTVDHPDFIAMAVQELEDQKTAGGA